MSAVFGPSVNSGASQQTQAAWGFMMLFKLMSDTCEACQSFDNLSVSGVRRVPLLKSSQPTHVRSERKG